MMRSKLIRIRGPVITPFMFLLCVVLCCLMIAISARVADKWHEKNNEDVSICPFCNQPVQLPSQ